MSGRQLTVVAKARRPIYRLVQSALAMAFVLLLGLNAPLPAKELPATHSINLNTATMQQLEQLPGIGPSRAQKILDYRRKSGSFRSVNDLLVIRGISKKELDKIRPYIMVGAAPSHPPPAAKPKPKTTLPKTTTPKATPPMTIPPSKGTAPSNLAPSNS
jgi:competence ComEA-like helix-hairpin-helix protein